ncbi:hypothetical protein J3B02_001398 [Coemansia erecta]|nr:hypothetical protein J3B02_001398 [Coemansia erecta]
MCCQDSHNTFVKKASAGAGTSASSLGRPCGYASLSELEIYEHCRAFGHDFYDR